jgi:hypothetical protein
MDESPLGSSMGSSSSSSSSSPFRPSRPSATNSSRFSDGSSSILSPIHSSSAYVVTRALQFNRHGTPFEPGVLTNLFGSIPSSDMRTKVTAHYVSARNMHARRIGSRGLQYELLRRHQLRHKYKLPREYKRPTHPLNKMHNASEEDERFDKFDVCTTYTIDPPWLGVDGSPQEVRGLTPSEIPHLRHLVNELMTMAAALLDKGLDCLLYNLAGSIGINVKVPAGWGQVKPLDASIILDILAPGTMMPGENTFFIKRRITNKEVIWHVRLPRVSVQHTMEMSVDSERKVQEAEDRGQLMIMRYWYSRFPVKGKAPLGILWERGVTDLIQFVNIR